MVKRTELVPPTLILREISCGSKYFDIRNLCRSTWWVLRRIRKPNVARLFWGRQRVQDHYLSATGATCDTTVVFDVVPINAYCWRIAGIPPGDGLSIERANPSR
ncbi:hypothetical protein NPIL_525291 [Nephila pilipes]|uniref:Uncharacterized protein n=1 Tax=Nephila pilipes TaxID=299642 RepID=A0A8X6TLJ8_NEPPI|nr:hypothetical protein NPIL_525291 [Nephila pilipes]